jgi:hypothetical protein
VDLQNETSASCNPSGSRLKNSTSGQRRGNSGEENENRNQKQDQRQGHRRRSGIPFHLCGRRTRKRASQADGHHFWHGGLEHDNERHVAFRDRYE